MDCPTCKTLLEDYRRKVDTFNAAVENSRGTVGDDGCLAARQAAHLADKCKQIGDRLMEHWRKVHGGVPAKSGS
jgi:hypothetical protein